MSTTFGEIKCNKTKGRVIEVYTGIAKDFERVVRIFAYDKTTESGKKIDLTEETWRELITALETAGNSIGWEE